LLGIEPSQTVPGFCAGGARALVILPAGKTAADFGLTPAPAAWALASSIAAGIPQVLPPTRETFVPQAVNLELVDGVSFSKGCYPGQEVVSRLQHLGETNRRAAVGILSAEAAAPAGAPVYAKGEEVGRVVRAVTLGGRTLVLFSATIGSLLTGITLTPDGQPLELVELPYRYRNILKTSA
ncbi:MAG: tRNA-modifying protein YgfZ, partial [Sutterella wadsworthensis]|nr:tRNA-modifying protein YgfZ [Sutterella wadsworthensis]